MQKIAFISLFLLLSNFIYGQEYTAEEKKDINRFNKEIANPNSPDTTLAKAYLGLSEILYIANLDTIIPLCNKTIEIAEKSLTKKINAQEKLTLLTALSGAMNNVGYVYKTKGDIEIALNYYKKSLEINEEINDKSGIATLLNNIGFVYRSQGNIYQAIEYYQKALTIHEELGDKEGMASIYNNLGIIYYDQLDYDNALKFYKKTLAFDKETNYDKGIANTYNNIGLIYYKKGDFEKALDYYHQSLKIKEKIHDQIGIALCYSHMGELFEVQDNLKAAREFYEKSLTILEEQGDKRWTSYLSKDMADILLKLHEIDLAEEYAQRSYKLSKELGFPANISHSAQTLSKINKIKGNYKDALELFELHTSMKDSILNEDIINKTKTQQLKYEFEKAQAIQQAEHKKDIEILAQKEQKQKAFLYGTIAILLLVSVMLGIIFNRLKITKQQKVVIENQKLIVETAKIQLEEKNKEVIDSINYAKRIQEALLKSEEHQSPHLPEHFILFKPKDIVSGDFYWAMEKDNHLYLAVGDCTGHGVPGALLTMLGNSFLNEINAVDQLLNPAEILNLLRQKIITELNQTGKSGESFDGMDISLMRLNLKNYELQWAGANNPLYLISNNILSEVKPDKQPIGYNYKMTDFTNHQLQINKGDYLCIFTDGFADQFGGPKGKKYKYTSFKNKLLEIYQKSMPEQKQTLLEEFETWKGNLQQIDDVCIIGVRV